MKKILSLSYLLLLASSVTYAGGEKGYTYPPLSSDKCIDAKVDPNDKYYVPAQMPGGKFKGECLEISQRRNIKLIKNKSNSNIKIANFFHDNKFWFAELPDLKNIEKAIFQIEYFFPEFLAAHTQMRFDLAKDSFLKLTAQDGSGEILKLNSFIISFEAVRRIGFPAYGLVKGVRKHFAMGARMFSLQTAFDKVVLTQDHKNDQVLLNFNQEERIELLKKLLVLGENNSNYVEVYDTLDNNCTTKLYEGIEIVRPTKEINYYSPRDGYTRKVKKSYALEFLPSFANEYLKFKDVVEKELPNLGEEFNTIKDIYISK